MRCDFDHASFFVAMHSEKLLVADLVGMNIY